MPIPAEIKEEIEKLKNELWKLCLPTYRNAMQPQMAFDLETIAEKLYLNGVRRIDGNTVTKVSSQDPNNPTRTEVRINNGV